VASWEISSSQLLLWDPFHISETNRARKLKFGALVGIVGKNFSGMGRLGRSAMMRYINRHSLSIYLSISTPLFVLGPLHISETIRSRKLKFGTLVEFYEC